MFPFEWIEKEADRQAVEYVTTASLDLLKGKPLDTGQALLIALARFLWSLEHGPELGIAGAERGIDADAD